MIALALSATLVATVPLAYVHGHASAMRQIKVELREIAAADDQDRPPGRKRTRLLVASPALTGGASSFWAPAAPINRTVSMTSSATLPARS